MKEKLSRLLILVGLSAVFLSVGIHETGRMGKYSRLHERTVESNGFRRQLLDEQMEAYVQQLDRPGEILGLYWLEGNFSNEPFPKAYTAETFRALKKSWSKKPAWNTYAAACKAVWDDLKYFPVPEPAGSVKAEISFVDSWMYERSYGGKRGHEGTDIMASENVRGYYPVVSMTDGVVLHKGWLEQGGYRIGITAPGGAYFYYAHLDSYADLEIGDTVKAGELLGFMGDTGYSKTEGTTGNFPVHLHVGIYLTDTGKEISVNPYAALKYLETRRIKCVYERG